MARDLLLRQGGRERSLVPCASKPGRAVTGSGSSLPKTRPLSRSSCERVPGSGHQRGRDVCATRCRGDAGEAATYTSLWWVYTRSKRASGAIHLTGSRPCTRGRNEKNSTLKSVHLSGLGWAAPCFKSRHERPSHDAQGPGVRAEMSSGGTTRRWGVHRFGNSFKVCIYRCGPFLVIHSHPGICPST